MKKTKNKILVRKLSGFSLAEVLFNMILITIVIGCGYLGYEYAFSDMNLFDKANNNMQDFVQFSNAITIDKEKCKTIRTNENEISFETGEEKTTYKFLENKILRVQEMASDTFHIVTKNLQSSYEGNKTKTGLTEKIEIETDCSGKKLFLLVKKDYDAYTKMKLTERNGN